MESRWPSGGRLLGTAISGLLLFGLSADGVLAQRSPGYTARRVCVTTVAASSSSASYTHIASESPVVGAAGRCPSGSVSTLGFWSILGSAQIPVLLSATRDVSDPSAIRLGWSGQAGAFTVYKSSSPVDVVSLGNIEATTTGSCEYVDSTPGAAQIFFYRVTPAASPTPDPEAR